METNNEFYGCENCDAEGCNNCRKPKYPQKFVLGFGNTKRTATYTVYENCVEVNIGGLFCTMSKEEARNSYRQCLDLGAYRIE